jgi:glutamate N-acetyltransferase/amino-acid N-acetyltransferase
MSTGLIGAQLDMDKVTKGIATASRDLSPESGPEAARAIMTTDTRPKHCAVSVEGRTGRYSIGGIAKGAGMIHPDMATMLALITTDADVEPSLLQSLLAGAADRSFHRISVDGDTSTNDTVLLLANGSSGVPVEADGSELFAQALRWVCRELAMAIVRDGEGASRLLELHITGARSEEEALLAARAIATSPLVKTAVAGGDPNWGRIIAAAGRSGAQLDAGRLRLWVGPGDSPDTLIVDEGTEVSAGLKAAGRAFKGDELSIRLDLAVGEAETRFWTTDLTHEYVSINAEYHT